jgi:hypothetical protein
MESGNGNLSAFGLLTQHQKYVTALLLLKLMQCKTLKRFIVETLVNEFASQHISFVAFCCRRIRLF